MIPNHIVWSINNVEYGNYSELPLNETPRFNYTFQNLYKDYNPEVTHKEAVRNRLASLQDKRLAICLSGMDSELIAREAKDMGLDVDLYFLDFFGQTEHIRTVSESVAKELAIPLNVVTVSTEECFHLSELNFLYMRVAKPTYLIMPHLFDKIPQSQHIIVGEGDLRRTHDIYDQHVKKMEISVSEGMITSSTQICYWLYQQKFNREGSYYFFSTTPELITSMWNDVDHVKEFPVCSTRKVIEKFWGDKLSFREKTDNWENAKMVNFKIRNHLREKYSLESVRELPCDIIPSVDGKLGK